MTDDMIDGAPGSMQPGDFLRFRALIHKHAGIWLRDGKQVMLASRLARRLRVHGLATYTDYAALLEQMPAHDEALHRFINAVTTNKTSFFRERHHFDFLTRHLVPDLKYAAAKGGDRTIRVWSAACSTGEEPYSIVMTLLDALRGAGGTWTIKVVASDVDTDVLTVAQQAVYAETAVETIEESIRRRYFLRGKGEMSGSVKVKSEVTQRVELKRINLMDRVWPIEGRFDAIFFRNALIYFQQNIQNQFLRRMLQHLKPEGLLFLGHSEHVPWLYDAVTPLHGTIYRHGPAHRQTVSPPGCTGRQSHMPEKFSRIHHAAQSSCADHQSIEGPTPCQK